MLYHIFVFRFLGNIIVIKTKVFLYAFGDESPIRYRYHLLLSIELGICFTYIWRFLKGDYITARWESGRKCLRHVEQIVETTGLMDLSLRHARVTLSAGYDKH